MTDFEKLLQQKREEQAANKPPDTAALLANAAQALQPVIGMLHTLRASGVKFPAGKIPKFEDLQKEAAERGYLFIRISERNAFGFVRALRFQPRKDGLRIVVDACVMDGPTRLYERATRTTEELAEWLATVVAQHEVKTNPPAQRDVDRQDVEFEGRTRRFTLD